MNTESASEQYTEPDDDVEATVGSSSTAGQSDGTAGQSGVAASSTAGARQAQSPVNLVNSVHGYVPLPQLVDCISPYTVVDTA